MYTTRYDSSEPIGLSSHRGPDRYWSIDIIDAGIEIVNVGGAKVYQATNE